MNTNNPIQTKKTTLLETIDNHFKCKFCGTISQPIAETAFSPPPEYNLLDIYICIWCDTGFVLTDTIEGYINRNDLSQELVASWNPCVF